MLIQPTTGLESTATQLKRISCLHQYEDDCSDDELMPYAQPQVLLALASQQASQNFLPEKLPQKQGGIDTPRDFYLKRARSSRGLHRSLINPKEPSLTKLICEKLLGGSYAYGTTGEFANFARFHRGFLEL